MPYLIYYSINLENLLYYAWGLCTIPCITRRGKGFKLFMLPLIMNYLKLNANYSWINLPFFCVEGQNGKYWHCDSESVSAETDNPEGFYLELREPTRICIKSTNGSYLTANKNGAFRLGDSNVENATQWEY